MKNQGIKVADLPEDAHVTITLTSDEFPKASNVYTFRMLKNSPLRRLFELQEIYEEGFDYAKATGTRNSRTDTGRH